MLDKRPLDDPYLEIQVHPSDIRRGVWYFFLTRKRVAAISALVGGLALFFLVNVVIGPMVLANLLRRNDYRNLAVERERQGGRLQELIAELEEVSTESESLSLDMSRIFLAYGLDPDPKGGQGGYPFAVSDIPDSIYSAAIRRGSGLQSRLEEELQVLGTFIDEVQSFESAHGDQVETTPSLTPLKSRDFVLTSPFGTRRSPFTKAIDFHPGVDMAAPTGTDIYAPADGYVVFAGRYPLKQSVSWWRYGNMVAIRHGERFITLYGHCDSVSVSNGDKVRQGDVIGTVGNTGWSTSSHLHYEVRHRGDDGEFKPVDPRIYILDHQWRDEEQLLVRARSAPDPKGFEPLPRLIGR